MHSVELSQSYAFKDSSYIKYKAYFDEQKTSKHLKYQFQMLQKKSLSMHPSIIMCTVLLPPLWVKIGPILFTEK